ncbi:hypothetical protein RhiJN_11152 [Ceratobasidium sp. AG-Ba]|nr:hypothetical protein RhiJN_11152 [Ceratobasidium sp. AG-Ba]QRW11857.1 hypothetical protein RhiLY_10856 [Ceratobasidium sp. AG-Ba]
MPVFIAWDENALAYLISPPPPSYVLRDVLLGIRASQDLNALSMLGKVLMRSLVIARLFQPPIAEDFEERIEARLTDQRLARIAQEAGLLARLNVQDLAVNDTDIAHLLYAYLGATLRCAWSQSGSNSIHQSVNDICSVALDYEGSVNGHQSADD